MLGPQNQEPILFTKTPSGQWTRKIRRFSIGDLVLRKVTPATKDPTHGKLGPTWEGPYKIIHYSRQGSYHLESMDGIKLPRPWNVEHLKRYH